MNAEKFSARWVGLVLEGRRLKEHVLNRLGYGLSGWHEDRYDQLGLDAYLAEQLGGSLPATGSDGAAVEPKFERSVLARRQLEVVLLDFWFNHFNVDATGGIAGRTLPQYLQAIQGHILGNFGDMLLATARAPAMLTYLDNRTNFEEETVNGKVYGLNENYARELLELHTLGVDGGYTETDVVEVARVMTGWSIAQDAFHYRRARHDAGQKVVLGATFPAGRGEDEGVDLLAMLAAHSSTASFISRKLCMRFVSENPSSDVVNAGAQAFDRSDGNLSATVQAILTSPGFRREAAFRSKVKPPMRYLASAVLAMGASSKSDFSTILGQLVPAVSTLGENPFTVAPPTGYPEASAYWVSSASMHNRFRFAGLIAGHGPLQQRLRAVTGTNGANVSQAVDAVSARICPGGISSATRGAATRFVTDTATSNSERIGAAAHALLASPEFVRF